MVLPRRYFTKECGTDRPKYRRNGLTYANRRGTYDEMKAGDWMRNYNNKYWANVQQEGAKPVEMSR